MIRVLLLTGCANPQGIKCANSTEERQRQYITAINFYLNYTNLPIVYVDNSNWDISVHFKNNNRVECLSFDGIYDKTKGKGYGEAIIIKYALQRSQFLYKSDQIIKITGRHIIRNINNLLSTSPDSNKVYIDVDIKLQYARSYFFIANRLFFEKYFLPNMELINDSIEMHFEKVLGLSIKKWINSGKRHHQFLFPIYIIGNPGANKKMYTKPSINRYIMIFAKYFIYNIYSKIYRG